jgi:hypothetical protein
MRTRRWPRRLLITLGVLALLVLVVRLVADPIATHYTRKALENSEGFKGAISGTHVGFLPPSFAIHRLKLIEQPKGDWDEPLLFAERIVLGVDWRALLHGNLVARTRIEKPKIVMARRHEEKKEKGKEITEVLSEMSPMKVDRIEVVDGEILFAAAAAKGSPQIWIHDLELAAENIATREAMMEGRPTTLSARAKVQRSGVLTMFVSMDPWAKGLTFAGEAALRDLAGRDLYSFVAPSTELQIPKGTVDVFSEFTVKDGRIKGGVKPVLKNIEVRSADDGLFDKLKAWLADEAVEIASDRVPGRNAVATVVPITGNIENPNVQLVPAILGVLRNAFVTGLASGFRHLPPPTAEKKEGLLEQAKEAFTRDEGPPQAQPAKNEGDKKSGDRQRQGRAGRNERR